MNIEKFKTAYQSDEVVQAICDILAERVKNQSETKLHRIIHYLNEEGYKITRPGAIAAFRKLEEAECGQYVEGRHGHRSRFAWSVKTMLLKDVATGQTNANSADSASDKNEADLFESDVIEHTFMLRSDYRLTIELPEDLTRLEAKRLSKFVDSLSFLDDSSAANTAD